MSDHSELKRLAKGATPGPWVKTVDGVMPEGEKFGIFGNFGANNGEANREFIAAANPAAVLALIAEVEALRKDRTDWQAECLKRGFEYVRESDDHYVLADLPEMADLIGALLGVEVRSKENDAYEEANSRLNEQIDGLINTIHAQEALRKDAERYRWLRQSKHFDSPQHQVFCEFYADGLDVAIDEAMSKGEQP